MSMVKDSEFLEACLWFPVLHIREFQVPQCTGQGNLHNHTSTGSFCFGQSKAELALEACGDTAEPRKPVRPCTQACF